MAAGKATLKSYLQQWSEYFEIAGSEDDLMAILRNFAFDGRLRSCKFRSVCWRVFLKCLPCDICQWASTIEISRLHYVEVKTKHVTKPSRETVEKDLDVENPLSQNDKSSWNKFFKNSELKKTIERDVKRTFPEMEYFHDETVQKLLVDILFCYAQEHRDLSYRQGMHELLAPLVFIIHCDLQAACHAREIGELFPLMNVILSEEHLEHDAYNMFCQLMESTNAWYSVTDQGKKEQEEGIANETFTKDENSSITAHPFQPQEIATGGGPTLAITNKLNHIHNTLLVQHDLQLHTHFNRLEIIPQVFGLRWIRLLFGREFSLQDLLVLWDATFADSSSLDLVDYLFVAMLIHIRHYLLNADYSTCMQILMRYPPVDDINDIVKAAMRIRLLKGRSYSDCLKDDATRITGTGKVSKGVQNLNTSPAQQNNAGKQSGITRIFKDFTRKVMSENKSTAPLHSHLNDLTYAGHAQSPAQTKSLSGQKWQLNGSSSYFNRSQHLSRVPRAEEMHPKYQSQLEEDVAMLQQELNRMKQMCVFCADKIDSGVTTLQSSVSLTDGDEEAASESRSKNGESETISEGHVGSQQKKFEREQILITVAGLKQIRDLLRGILTYNPNLHEYVSAERQGAGNCNTERTPLKTANDNGAEAKQI